jgi:hypothetical protein
VTGSPGSAPEPPAYTERLHAPLWVWAVAAFLVLTLGVAYLFTAGELLAAGAVGVSGAMVAWGLLRAAAPVRVGGGKLVAGPASIPVRFLAEPVALDEAAARSLRGREADPGAFHLIRPWVAGAVRVELVDPRDPHPYWYVATRHPEDLAAAITMARKTAGVAQDGHRPAHHRPSAR